MAGADTRAAGCSVDAGRRRPGVASDSGGQIEARVDEGAAWDFNGVNRAEARSTKYAVCIRGRGRRRRPGLSPGR